MKKYRKNSRKNPWRNTWNKKKIPIENLWAIILAITIPIMVICLASNLLLRLPDVYQYELRSSQAIQKTGKVIKEEKVIKLFGDFMQGKTDQFKLMEEVSYEPENIFNDQDQKAMEGFRRVLNYVLLIGIVATLVTAAGYFFLLRWRRHALLISGFKAGIYIFVILTIINGLIKVVPFIREKTWGQVFGTSFPKHDVLVQLLGNSFALHMTIFDTILSSIMMGLLGYLTWQVAGQKKLFKKF